MKNLYPLKFILKHEIHLGSEVIKEINYRRPKAKDLKKIKPTQLETGDLIDLFNAICDATPGAVDEMDAEDAMAAIGVVSTFLAGGQEIGG